MTDHEHFNIRHVRGDQIGEDTKCPVCGDGFRTNFLAVCDARGEPLDGFTETFLAVCDATGEPLCDLCGWEKDQSLAGVLYLCDMVCAFRHAEPPPHIVHELGQRRTDPEGPKLILKEVYEPLYDNGRGPLAELVAGQVKAAPDSGNDENG